jgi:RimJ/RimL family protein N-acetyltransferase
MLTGKQIDLELVERAHLGLLHGWVNDVEFVGEFEPFDQVSLASLEKDYDAGGTGQMYFVRKKDGTRIGYIAHFRVKDCTGIGYMLVPGERGRGYGTEAVRMMVDYLFLHRDIVRIQAETHPANAASQRVLEKAGFRKEGVIRQSFFSRGVYRDTALWSILRHEWREPGVLPRGFVSPAAP